MIVTMSSIDPLKAWSVNHLIGGFVFYGACYFFIECIALALVK